MLVTSETIRDVLCNEVIQLDKCIKATSCDITKDMRDHLCNIVNILISPQSFGYVPCEVATCDMDKLANCTYVEDQAYELGFVR